jgi:hypothetical protein
LSAFERIATVRVAGTLEASPAALRMVDPHVDARQHEPGTEGSVPSRHCWRFEFAICSVPASKPSARSSRSAHGMSFTRPSRRGSSGCSLSASTSRPTASPSCSMPPGSVVWSLNWRAKTPLLRPRLSQSSTPPSWRRPSNDPAHGPGGRDVDHPYPHAPPAPGRSEVDHRAGGRGAVAAEAGSRRYADQGLVRAHRWRRRIGSAGSQPQLHVRGFSRPNSSAFSPRPFRRRRRPAGASRPAAPASACCR